MPAMGVKSGFIELTKFTYILYFSCNINICSYTDCEKWDWVERNDGITE